MLTIIDPASPARWQVALRAARLVSDTGVAPLPQPYGEMETIQITNLERFGIGPHPLQQRYPGLLVQHHWLVIPEAWKVTRRNAAGVEKTGVALYYDFNGSTVSLSVGSTNGRNIIAPWEWEESEPGSPTDPVATGGLECRSIDGMTWYNYLAHGPLGHDSNWADWLDGVPRDLRTMYDPVQGRVLQSIFVPKEVSGIGVAEQTMQGANVNNTVSFLVYFPKREFANLRLQREYNYSRQLRGATRGGGAVLEAFGADDEALSMSAGFGSAGDLVDNKLAAGGEIQQHVRRSLLGPAYFNDQPTALTVLWPISEAVKNNLYPMPTGRQRF